MAVQTGQSKQGENQYLRPLVPIVIVLVVAAVFLFVGNLIAVARGADPATIGELRWLPFLGIGAVIAYGFGLLALQRDLWRIGTREVVYMAIGAALYGVLSYITNVAQLPSVSQVALRPAIVIPIFFGVVFGPAVGFFAGFVGNVLGDALTGWGVFPIWDIGNGLIGLVAGLALAFPNRRRTLDVLVGIVVVVCVTITALIVTNPVIIDPNGDGTATMSVADFWWVPLLAAALAVGLRFVLRNRVELAAAQVWGALAIIVGIGFAAISDIWWNGYSPATALLGEFLPAAGSNLINALILLPLLLGAWQTASAQRGR